MPALLLLLPRFPWFAPCNAYKYHIAIIHTAVVRRSRESATTILAMTSKFVRHKNSLQLYFNRHFIEYILHVVVAVVVRLPATGGKALQCTLGYSVARVRL